MPLRRPPSRPVARRSVVVAVAAGVRGDLSGEGRGEGDFDSIAFVVARYRPFEGARRDVGVGAAHSESHTWFAESDNSARALRVAPGDGPALVMTTSLGQLIVTISATVPLKDSPSVAVIVRGPSRTSRVGARARV